MTSKDVIYEVFSAFLTKIGSNIRTHAHSCLTAPRCRASAINKPVGRQVGLGVDFQSQGFVAVGPRARLPGRRAERTPAPGAGQEEGCRPLACRKGLLKFTVSRILLLTMEGEGQRWFISLQLVNKNAKTQGFVG